MGIETIKKFIAWCKDHGKNPSHVESLDEYNLCLRKS